MVIPWFVQEVTNAGKKRNTLVGCGPKLIVLGRIPSLSGKSFAEEKNIADIFEILEGQRERVFNKILGDITYG